MQIPTLEQILAEFPRAEVFITRTPKISELPWSCDICAGEGGYGSGSTLDEAVQDALLDFAEH